MLVVGGRPDGLLLHGLLYVLLHICALQFDLRQVHRFLRLHKAQVVLVVVVLVILLLWCTTLFLEVFFEDIFKKVGLFLGIWLLLLLSDGASSSHPLRRTLEVVMLLQMRLKWVSTT